LAEGEIADSHTAGCGRDRTCERTERDYEHRQILGVDRNGVRPGAIESATPVDSVARSSTYKRTAIVESSASQDRLGLRLPRTAMSTWTRGAKN